MERALLLEPVIVFFAGQDARTSAHDDMFEVGFVIEGGPGQVRTHKPGPSPVAPSRGPGEVDVIEYPRVGVRRCARRAAPWRYEPANWTSCSCPPAQESCALQVCAHQVSAGEAGRTQIGISSRASSRSAPSRLALGKLPPGRTPRARRSRPSARCPREARSRTRLRRSRPIVVGERSIGGQPTEPRPVEGWPGPSGRRAARRPRTSSDGEPAKINPDEPQAGTGGTANDPQPDVPPRPTARTSRRPLVEESSRRTSAVRGDQTSSLRCDPTARGNGRPSQLLRREATQDS